MRPLTERSIVFAIAVVTVDANAAPLGFRRPTKGFDIGLVDPLGGVG